MVSEVRRPLTLKCLSVGQSPDPNLTLLSEVSWDLSQGQKKFGIIKMNNQKGPTIYSTGNSAL